MIGKKIKEIAESRGLSQVKVGKLINRTKQAVASIYKRSTIEVDLLMQLSEKLDYDFFADLYNTSGMSKFKKAEIAGWTSKIDTIENFLKEKEALLLTKTELVETQRKLIAELEGKLKRREIN
ncbi:hypothetical protein GCM10027051_32600 [Niabella terrae]